jgi:hypothetical protein
MRGFRAETVGAAALALLLALGAGLPGLAHAQDPEASPTGPEGFLRCPECGLEFPAGEPDKPVLCPHCGEKHVTMQFSATGRGSDGSPERSYRFPLVMGALAATLAVAVAVLRRVTTAREAQRQPEAREQEKADPARRAEVARWHEELKRQTARRRGRDG